MSLLMTSFINRRMEATDTGFELINVIIDTPRFSRNKYKFDDLRQVFMLNRVLPLGTSFPYNFGFIPQTKGEDGDPLDVLVIMDEPAFPGCLIHSRLIGNIVAEQKELDGKVNRNDKIIAIAEAAATYEGILSLNDLNHRLITEIEQFFVYYNSLSGREFRPLRHAPAEMARDLVKQSFRTSVKSAA